MPLSEARLTESIVEDMVAVLDDAGWERAAMLVLSTTALPLFAATHPERTTALVNSSVRTLHDADYPDGVSVEALDEVLARLERQWGTGEAADGFAPTMAGDVRFRAWLGRSQRLTFTGVDAGWRIRGLLSADLQHTLPAIKVPSRVCSSERAHFSLKDSRG